LEFVQPSEQSRGGLAVLVFRHGILLVITGAVAGSLGAIAASRYLSSELYGVQVGDPMTWVSITIILVVTGTLAFIEPLRRASHTNALSMLKQD
jgi:putative ABC transport system permease protein